MAQANGNFLFMGEQDDPEFEMWAGRGIRIYDGTVNGEPDPREMPPVTPRAGGMIYAIRNGEHVACQCHPGARGSCAFGGPCVREEGSP